MILQINLIFTGCLTTGSAWSHSAGHSPQYGYLDPGQEYYFGNKE